MTRYMIQLASTPLNLASLLKNPEDRTEAIRHIVETATGSLEQYYNNFTEGVTFLIANFPDETSLASVTAAIYAGGGLTSVKALSILTASESVDVFKKAASIGYRPPGK